jgi:hypothetical protein
VGRHVLLKVEVGKLLILLQLKKSAKLGIGIDLTTILLILKAVCANIGVDLTSHLSSRKLSANGPSKKLSELLRNESGLDETGRSAVTSLTLTLGSLLCSAHLTGNVALKSSKFTAKRRKTGTKCVKLGAKLRKERTQGSLKSRSIGMSITSRGGSGDRSGSGGWDGSRGMNFSLGSLSGLFGLGSRNGSRC